MIIIMMRTDIIKLFIVLFIMRRPITVTKMIELFSSLLSVIIAPSRILVHFDVPKQCTKRGKTNRFIIIV